MGNQNGNAVVSNQDQDQQLIQPQEQVDVSLLVDQPTIKKVFAIKNPVYLKKETLSLEKDSQDPNTYYIQFFYDSLCDFNMYINFDVIKAESIKKSLLPKDKEEYIPAYTPSDKFKNRTIVFHKLPKGQNVQFLEKTAFIDLDFYEKNKTGEEESFDVVIEMVPILEGEQSLNEIVFVTLCRITSDDNDHIHYSIKSQNQRLKTQSMWIDIHDVFNTALDTGECLICCSSMRNTIFLPCKHSCTCNGCAHSLRMRNNPCPICKQPIEDLLILETDDEKKDENEILNKV